MPNSKSITLGQLRTELARQRTQLDAKIEAARRDVFDRFAQSEKRIESSMANLLAEHHASLTEAISNVVLNDRLRLLEARIEQLERVRS